MVEVSDIFLREFIHESNLIDPLPAGHLSVAGDKYFDDHFDAARYVVGCARDNTPALPLLVHGKITRNLKTGKDTAGLLRKVNVQIGKQWCPTHAHVPSLLAEWLAAVRVEFPVVRKNESEVERREWVLDKHVDFEHIHPFEHGNGRVGRLLMLNHIMLMDIRPWIFTHEKRDRYFAMFGLPRTVSGIKSS